MLSRLTKNTSILLACGVLLVACGGDSDPKIKTVEEGQAALAGAVYDFLDKSAVAAGGATMVWRMEFDDAVSRCKVSRRFINEDENAWADAEIGEASVGSGRFRDSGEPYVYLLCQAGLYAGRNVVIERRSSLWAQIYDEGLTVFAKRVDARANFPAQPAAPAAAPASGTAGVDSGVEACVGGKIAAHREVMGEDSTITPEVVAVWEAECRGSQASQ